MSAILIFAVAIFKTTQKSIRKSWPFFIHLSDSKLFSIIPLLNVTITPWFMHYYLVKCFRSTRARSAAPTPRFAFPPGPSCVTDWVEKRCTRTWAWITKLLRMLLWLAEIEMTFEDGEVYWSVGERPASMFYAVISMHDRMHCTAVVIGVKRRPMLC